MQGMKLKEGERLVSMVQLSPQLVAATQERRAQESGASPTEATDGAADATPGDDAELNSIERIGGPWLLLMSCKGRGEQDPRLHGNLPYCTDKHLLLAVWVPWCADAVWCSVLLCSIKSIERAFACMCIALTRHTQHARDECATQCSTPTITGKRVPVALFDIKSRGVQGIIGMKLADGDALSTVHLVGTGDEMVCASRQGLMSRLRTDDARVMSRATKGVKLMDLNDGDEVWTVARMAGSSDHVTEEQGH